MSAVDDQERRVADIGRIDGDLQFHGVSCRRHVGRNDPVIRAVSEAVVRQITRNVDPVSAIVDRVFQRGMRISLPRGVLTQHFQARQNCWGVGGLVDQVHGDSVVTAGHHVEGTCDRLVETTGCRRDLKVIRNKGAIQVDVEHARVRVVIVAERFGEVQTHGVGAGFHRQVIRQMLTHARFRGLICLIDGRRCRLDGGTRGNRVRRGTGIDIPGGLETIRREEPDLSATDVQHGDRIGRADSRNLPRHGNDAARFQLLVTVGRNDLDLRSGADGRARRAALMSDVRAISVRLRFERERSQRIRRIDDRRSGLHAIARHVIAAAVPHDPLQAHRVGINHAGRWSMQRHLQRVALGNECSQSVPSRTVGREVAGRAVIILSEMRAGDERAAIEDKVRRNIAIGRSPLTPSDR